MLFLDDSKKNIDLKKIAKMRDAFGSGHGVVCMSCRKPLTNEDSMFAGMGAVCLERTRFAEHLNREKLEEIEGVREPINKGLYPARTVILREKSEPQPRLVTVLSVEPLESIILDRTDLHEVYERTGSMAEAIAQSLYAFVPLDGESVAPMTSPKHPEVVREWKRFQKEIRGVYKERHEYLAENPFSSYYTQVLTKKGLTEEQNRNREELLNQKNTNPTFFNEGWARGCFHRATWIHRLNQTQLSEAKLLSSVLAQDASKLGEVPLKDYGLTDQEILSGLQHSNQLLEKNMFKSFLEGNRRLYLLVELYRKQSEIQGPEKILCLRVFSKISNNETFAEGEKQTLLNFLAKLKISPKLFD